MIASMSEAKVAAVPQISITGLRKSVHHKIGPSLGLSTPTLATSNCQMLCSHLASLTFFYSERVSLMTDQRWWLLRAANVMTLGNHSQTGIAGDVFL